MLGTSLIKAFQHDLSQEKSCFLVMIFSWKHMLPLSFSEFRKIKMKMLHRSSKIGYFLSAKKKTESSIKNMKKKTNHGNT